MSGSIRIYDTTLRDGIAGAGISISVDEAVTIARGLEKAGVTAIEAGYPGQSQSQCEVVEAVAAAVNGSEVAAISSCAPGEIAAAIVAVQYAARPVVHVYVSALEAREPGARTGVCRAIRHAVSTVCAAGIEAQFSIAGIEEMERPFRRQCIGVAMYAGATRIGVPDSTGTATTAEYTAMVRDIVQFVEPPVVVSAHCHNASGRAVQNALAAIEAGARQIEATVRGIGMAGGNTSLEAVAQGIHARYGECCVDGHGVAEIGAFLPVTSAPAGAVETCLAQQNEPGPNLAIGRPGWHCRVEVAAL